MTLFRVSCIIIYGIPRKIGDDMQVCFIGHRKIENSKELSTLLEETIIELINKGANTFFFGSKSDFDNLALKIVTELKKQFSFIKRIYVRSSFPVINNLYKSYLLKSYDETYFPKKLENAGKYSYVERNYEMIDNSTICVFYYNESYAPLSKRKSGTKTAYQYATRKKKEIINLYELTLKQGRE